MTARRILHAGLLLSVAALIQTAQAETNTILKATGTVVDAEGHPVAGAAVQEYRYRSTGLQNGRLEMQAGQTAQTGANGAFELQIADGNAPHSSLTLVARKAGLASAWRQMMASAKAEPRLVMTAPGFLAGSVVDEANKPLADVEVSVAVAFSDSPQEGMRRMFNYLSDKPARDCFSARTGADGKFRIDGFPTNASANLMATVPGKALRQTGQAYLGPETMQCRAGQEDIKLVMEPTGSIEGKIVLEEAGQPLPVAQLNLMPDNQGYFYMGPRGPDQSGADGVFRLKDVPAGSYRIRAVFGTNAAAAWVADTVPVSVESGQTKQGIQITAVRGGLLEIKVVEKNGRKPLDQVSVNAYQQTFQTGSVSSSNGVALLRLLPGAYQVSAYKEGWRGENSEATVETGSTNRVELELSPPLKLTGVVRRPDGQPAQNLPVRIVGDYSMEAADLKTDAEGKFETEWSAQRPQPRMGTIPCLLVRDPERNLAGAVDIDDDSGALDLRLAPGLTLAGRVECEGKPLTNAVVALVFWTGNSGMHLSGLSTATNVPGRFEIPALPPGRRYGLQVSAPGYGQKYVDLGPTEGEAKRVELDTVELRLANFKLAGKVVDTEDKPVAGAYVHMSGDDQPNDNVRTGRDGRFAFEHVCEGTVRLFANVADSNGNIAAEAGDTNVVLKLGQRETFSMAANGKPQKVKGTITDPDGKPVAEAQVTAFPMRSARPAKTEADGTYKLSWNLEPWQRQMGGAVLLVRQLARNLAAAQELMEDSTNLDVQLKPGLTIHGRVQAAAGTPLTNAQVGVWMQAARTRSQLSEQLTPTDAQGGFTISALPVEQDYTLFADAKGYGQKQLKVEVDWDTNRVELEPLILKLADQALSGKVVNMNEKPVSGVHVSLSGDGQPQGSVMTDSKGRFTLKVCEGQVRLFASGQSGFASITADAGDTNVVLQLSQNDGSTRREANRVSLRGKPLPDLISLGFAADAVPAGKPVLLCLLDIQQRPSRRLARLLTEQQDGLKEKGVTILALQAAAAGAEVFEEWKASNPVLFAVGRLSEKSPRPQWIAGANSLPWLILTDKQGRVSAEGFAIEELESKLEELSK